MAHPLRPPREAGAGWPSRSLDTDSTSYSNFFQLLGVSTLVKVTSIVTTVEYGTTIEFLACEINDIERVSI